MHSITLDFMQIKQETSFRFFIAGALTVLVVAGALLLGFIHPVRTIADSLNFLNSTSTCATATATSTVSYMRPGHATTTLTCDTYALGGSGKALGGASLRTYLSASTTNTQLNQTVEESMDGIDWFAVVSNEQATTSPTISLAVTETYNWKYASSSFGGAAVGASDNTGARVIDLPVRMRYVRVYSALTGANGAVWMDIVGKLEN